MDKKYLSEVIGDEYFDWGKRKIIIQAPTGSGKSTFIIQALLKKCLQNIFNGVKLAFKNVLNYF